jgi:poly-gamma-glutamate synthesis protein (capsule biosynthesis protein)
MSGYRKGIRIAVGLAVISAIVTVSCLRENDAPYTASEKEYLKFRAEGIPVSESVWSGVKYIRKYYNKRALAPDSTVNYFNNQAMLNASLRQFDDQPKVMSLAFLGDIMWIRNNWSGFLSNDVKSYLSGMDMVFGNLETPVDTTLAVPSFFPDYFSYNSSPQLINSFNREEGRGNILTAVSVSNNHAFDRGSEGLVRTTEFLKSKGIGVSGVSSDAEKPEKYLKFTRNGIKIGFYAASWGLNDPEEQNGDLKT